MNKYQEAEDRLQKLQEGEDLAWKSFYEEMRSPFRLFFMKKASLDPDEAGQLFHDTMIIFHRNVLRRKLTSPLQSSLKTYLFGIGKNVLRKEGRGGDWEAEIPEVSIEASIESAHERAAKAELVRSLLKKIGDSCRQLLELVYLKGYVMEAVARELNIANEGTVRKRKFDCLKKMRQLMQERTLGNS